MRSHEVKQSNSNVLKNKPKKRDARISKMPTHAISNWDLDLEIHKNQKPKKTNNNNNKFPES